MCNRETALEIIRHGVDLEKTKRKGDFKKGHSEAGFYVTDELERARDFARIYFFQHTSQNIIKFKLK